MQFISILILLLSLTLFIIGLINPKKALFWQKSSLNKTRKKSSIIYGLILIFSFISFGIFSDKEIENNENRNELISKMSRDEKVKYLINEEFMNEKDLLRGIDLNLTNQDSISVYININGKEYLPLINEKMSNLYYTLYNNNLPIKTASIIAYLPLIDEYGHTEEKIAYTTSLDHKKASLINWKLDEDEVKLLILPKLWTVLFLLPDLKNR